MLVITDKRVISFFENNPHLDINQMNGIFVDIMEKIIHNISDQMDDSHNSRILQSLVSKIENLENKQQNNDKLITDAINNHMETLIINMREMIQSNHGDSEKSLVSLINQNNNLFLNKLETLTNNSELNTLITNELNKINNAIIQENNKIEVSKTDNFDKIRDILINKYSELDKTIQTKMDCILSSQTSNQGGVYSQILTRLNENTDTINSVNNYFSKQLGSNTKGKIGEIKLEVLLSNIYPSAIIRNTAGQTACGDFIIERKDKDSVLIDTKDYETVVPIKEIEKILRDMESNSCHGILISQNSGIAQKEDFEINFHHNYIVIFIHNAKYDPEKIRLAINIIDHLEPILNAHKIQEGETISSELLFMINREYRELATHKLNIIHSMKKQQTDIISQIQKIDLPILTKYLNQKFANTGKTAFHCDICNAFSGKNAKSLAAHKRKCGKNITIKTS